MTRLFARIDASGHAHIGPDAHGAEGWQVVADATLYRRQRTCAELGLPHALAEAGAAALIAASLARGPQGFAALDGDIAAIAYHGHSHTLRAVRDFGGKRPLFYAWLGQRLLLATRVEDLLAEPDVPRALDLLNITSVASAMWGHPTATAYSAIHELPAGSMLEWDGRAAPRISRVNDFDLRPESPRRSAADAANELRRLLREAVRERLPAQGPVAVSLSGGWDSSAVYATAQAMHRDGEGPPVEAVSISYPPGDPGREDELIDSITAHWGARARYRDINSIPLANDWRAEAASRALPFAHAYEHWNRALSREARANGAEVILDGTGGDQLFQASDIVLADLLRRGAFVSLTRQLRARRHEGPAWRRLTAWGIMPLMPPSMLRAAARLARRPPPAHYLERFPAPWVRRDFVLRHGLLERERAARPALPARPFVTAESLAYLRFQFYPRIFSLLGEFARDEGIELRSPLLDRDVVAFALRRPWSDRINGRETKLSLRRAMQGLLPPEVLAPRPKRTGVTIAYFLRELRRTGWPVMESLLGDLRLADLGIVEPQVLRRAWDRLMQQDDGEVAVRAFFTLQTELWLRSRVP